MSTNNIDRRLGALESESKKVNNCSECKDYNSAAYFARQVIRGGKHYTEVELQNYQCLTCGKVPTRTEKEMQEDYGKMIVDFHAGRPIWGFENNAK
jgi:hypothetical protein